MRHSEDRAQVDIEDQEPPVEELADDAVVCADGASTWCSWIDEFWTVATSCGLRPELVTLVPKNVLDGLRILPPHEGGLIYGPRGQRSVTGC